MFVAPRSRPHWEGLHINALGYAGLVLVRPEAMSRLERVGPVRLLQEVTGLPEELVDRLGLATGGQGATTR